MLKVALPLPKPHLLCAWVYMLAPLRACMYAYVYHNYKCVCMCVRACVRACVSERACVYICVCVYVYVSF